MSPNLFQVEVVENLEGEWDWKVSRRRTFLGLWTRWIVFATGTERHMREAMESAAACVRAWETRT